MGAPQNMFPKMSLPAEMLEEEPVYVNPKQYERIMHRRKVRARLEKENKMLKSRKVITFMLKSFYLFIFLTK